MSKYWQRKRKIVLLALCATTLSFLLCACKEEPSHEDMGESVAMFSAAYTDFEAAIDLDFTKQMINDINDYEGERGAGLRTATSQGETEAAELIAAAMTEIGLQNVTRDQVSVDGWTFGGASIFYEDRNGIERKVKLGGYPSSLTVTDEKMSLVYRESGFARNYGEELIPGRIVLIDYDMSDDMELGHYVYQARSKGARAVLIATNSPELGDEELFTQNVGVSGDTPVFAISKLDAEALKAMIKSTEEDEFEVLLSAQSRVVSNASTTNVWGDIPGKTTDVIYLSAHYDGYTSSLFGNGTGISSVLGIAKAVMSSGYIPEKTIRVVAHGAGEWGKSGTAYSWGMGAYKQITQKHPEWIENAFAVINLDGAQPFANEIGFSMGVSYPLLDFVSASAGPLIDYSHYQYDIQAPASIDTDAFSWQQLGIPAITALPMSQLKLNSAVRHGGAYAKEIPVYSDDAITFVQKLYGKILLDLDECLIVPVNYGKVYDALQTSLSDQSTAEMPGTSAAIGYAIEKGRLLAEKVQARNQEFLQVDDASKTAMRVAAIETNRKLHQISAKIEDDFSKITWQGQQAFPHENQKHNLKSLKDALSMLEIDYMEKALPFLFEVDFGIYSANFDKATCDIMQQRSNAGTWAEGRMETAPCYVDDVVRSLLNKITEKASGQEIDEDVFKASLKGDMEQLETLIKTTEASLEEIYSNETLHVEEQLTLINEILESAFNEA